MLALTFLLVLVQGLIQYPQQAGDGLDEATRVRMQQRAEYLKQQMAQLLQELEQKELEQSGGVWGAQLVWQYWALTGILVLLLALWFGLAKITRDPDNSSHKERSSSNLVEEEEEGYSVVAKKETESSNAKVEEDSQDGNKEGNDVDAKAESKAKNAANEVYDSAKEEGNHEEKEEEANAAASEEDKHSAKEEGNHEEKEEEANAAASEEDKHSAKEEGNCEEKEEEANAAASEEDKHSAKEEGNREEKEEEANAAASEEDKHGANEEDHEHNVNRNLGSLLEELPVLDLDKGCSVIMNLMDKLTHIFQQGLSNSFYPVPQQAIGVGSAFEGWSPHAQDLVYHVLVPLSPPPGHAFHLEMDTAGMLQRNCHVRVELLCACTRKQLPVDMLCFLHHPEDELRRTQDPSLLHTLCTGTYLDVQKTVHWFCRFIRVAWLLLPESCHWRLMLQPSSRSCRFQLSKDNESFTVEIIFGVRQGGSDIFVGSQPTEVGIPSTTWLETYAVAEAKFFGHISRQAPQDSWHCKCLQLLTRCLLGVAFPSYALKTAVMHLLSTVPLTQWRRGHFQQRLMDILKYLHCSLEAKQLHHFIIGNERLPEEIRLPSGFRLAEPPNLFQHMASNPAAHTKAVQEYNRLLHRLQQLLSHGQ